MPPNTLYRLSGQVGVVAAIVLLFNDARRVGLVPENAFTHQVAPIAALLSPLALTGIYLWQRDRAGAVGLAGFALTVLGLVGSAAIEFTLHYVFPLLPKETVDSLVDGRTGRGFLFISVLFLAGTILFGLAMWRADRFPKGAI